MPLGATNLRFTGNFSPSELRGTYLLLQYLTLDETSPMALKTPDARRPMELPLPAIVSIVHFGNFLSIAPDIGIHLSLETSTTG